MKKILYLLAFSSLLLFTGCDPDDHDPDNNLSNRVLMLKVDYRTFAFEGGYEYRFDQKTDSYTIDATFIDTSDISTIRLTYKELNKTLFFGSMIWNGMGEVTIPESMKDPDEFEAVLTDDVVFPPKGFVPVFNPYDRPIDYLNVWMSIQNLQKVREFIQYNPDQKVKIFIYTPDYYGNTLNWDYYIFIHN